MATPPDAPPSSADGKAPNPVSQAPQQTTNDHLESKAEPVKESSPPSVFVNSEPIREDQVQNAVKFLSHPKVKGSPVMYRRSFLERKGLTKEEVDEAFRRVPDEAPAVNATQSTVTNLDGQIKSSSNVQQQPPTQVMQPTPAGPVAVSKMGAFSQFHWYHAILAVGFLAASGAGTAVLFKKSIVPRFKSWIRKVVSEEDEEGEETLMKKKDAKPSVAEEAAAAAKAAAAAAADVARASQDILVTKSEEKKCFEELINILNVQVQEMKSMGSAIQKLEIDISGQSTNFGRVAVDEQYSQRVSRTNSGPYTNGRADAYANSVRSLSPPASAEPSVAPHPKSYMDILEMIQRGEKPSNIREINDAPPNPNQPLSNPRVAPRAKPWEVAQAQETNNNGSIYDSPNNQLNGDDTVPWWQKKNVRITEAETGDENKFGSSIAPINERPPPQRSWVPPQPPPVAMAEAAAAIRQPKKPAYLSEQMTDDQLLSRSTEVTDELQRITKISESGGAVAETNGEGSSSAAYSEEMAKEGNGAYVEA